MLLRGVSLKKVQKIFKFFWNFLGKSIIVLNFHEIYIEMYVCAGTGQRWSGTFQSRLQTWQGQIRAGAGENFFVQHHLEAIAFCRGMS